MEEIRDRLKALAVELNGDAVSDTAAGELAAEAAELTDEAAREASGAVARLEQGG